MGRNEFSDEALELKEIIKTALSVPGVTHGRSFINPIIDFPLGATGEILRLKPMELRIMMGLAEGKDADTIANESNSSAENVNRILRSVKFKKFYTDRLQLKAIELGWGEERVLKELEDVWFGKKEKSKNQIESMRMIKDIIQTKSEQKIRKEQPIINIDMRRVDQMLEHQKVIDAKVIENGRPAAAENTGNL